MRKKERLQQLRRGRSTSCCVPCSCCVDTTSCVVLLALLALLAWLLAPRTSALAVAATHTRCGVANVGPDVEADALHLVVVVVVVVRVVRCGRQQRRGASRGWQEG